MKITKRFAREVARATRQYCHREGSGRCIAVFPDGTWAAAASSNSLEAKRMANGGLWLSRIACIRTPMPAATVYEILQANEAIGGN